MHRTRISSLIGASFVASLFAAQPAAAVIVYSNNFSTPSTCSFVCPPIVGGAVLTAPSGEMFLGLLGQGQSATLTLSGLNTNTPHTMITIGFTLDVIGSVDGTGPVVNGTGAGDFFTVGYRGSNSGTPFNYAFANYGGGNQQSYPTAGSAPTTGASTVNALKYSGFPDSGNGVQDSEYNFGSGGLAPITFVDSGDSLTITFTGLSNEEFFNEFYGIDNIVVSTNATPGAPPVRADVPEPAPVLLLGIGLVAFLAEKRRRR